MKHLRRQRGRVGPCTLVIAVTPLSCVVPNPDFAGAGSQGSSGGASVEDSGTTRGEESSGTRDSTGAGGQTGDGSTGESVPAETGESTTGAAVDGGTTESAQSSDGAADSSSDGSLVPCGEDECDPLVEVCDVDACVCGVSFTDCDGECVNTEANPDHCGGCDSPCGGGTPLCGDSSCISEAACAADDEVESCEPGACNDVSQDPLHCGGCDMPCDPTEVCDDEVCESPD